MPKGVDHRPDTGIVTGGAPVQKSLMPKGVDHYRSFLDGLQQINVQKSLMPKGVDHSRRIEPSVCAVCAKIFDAERR